MAPPRAPGISPTVLVTFADRAGVPSATSVGNVMRDPAPATALAAPAPAPAAAAAAISATVKLGTRWSYSAGARAASASAKLEALPRPIENVRLRHGLGLAVPLGNERDHPLVGRTSDHRGGVIAEPGGADVATGRGRVVAIDHILLGVHLDYAPHHVRLDLDAQRLGPAAREPLPDGSEGSSDLGGNP